MNKGLEALKEIKDNLRLFGFDEDTDNFKLLDTIEKELKRLEELEKAFDALSKDDEKAKKELSKEIEKNRALEIIKRILGRIDYLDMCLKVWKIISQEEYDLLKEVLIYDDEN